MERIHWTDEEQLKVSQEYFNMRFKGLLPSRTEEGWRKAQEAVLPPQRWRPFTTSAAASGMNKNLSRLLAMGKIQIQPVKVIQPPPPEKQTILINGHPVSKDTYDLVVNHHKAVSPPPATLDDFLRNMMTEQIQKALPSVISQIEDLLKDQQESFKAAMNANYVKFMKAVDPNFKEEIESPPPPLIPAEALAPAQGHKEVVVLVNAMEPQRQAVQDDFPQYEIRAVQDRVPGEKNPLLVVGFTKFMNKSTDTNCVQKFGEKYLRVGHKGATSEARIKIRQRLQHYS